MMRKLVSKVRYTLRRSTASVMKDFAQSAGWLTIVCIYLLNNFTAALSMKGLTAKSVLQLKARSRTRYAEFFSGY